MIARWLKDLSRPLLVEPPRAAPATRLGPHLLALVVVAVGVGLLFLREPGFGDDLTYWSFAFDLHEQGLKAWQVGSFHDLRWPVWIWCWILQAICGFGVASYYGVPLLYLAGGAVVAFLFGRRVLHSHAAAWACAIAFLFHPLLDTVAYRPMPDLSEGVLGGAVLLAWWAAMRAATHGRSLSWAALTGLLIYVVESNRITGIFIVPVLVVSTLCFFPRRFGWLVIAGIFAALFYGAECGFYRWLFGDWLHNVHANLGAKGRKGTESIALWFLPLRFFDTLWKGGPLAPVYCVLALVGIPVAWLRSGVAGRLTVVWFTTLYLEYSCAPQSLWPWRPLIRDADRFLCGLTIPMAVLAAAGLAALWRACAAPRVGHAWWARPLTLGTVGIAACTLVSTRDRFDPGFVPEMRRYMAALATGTKVFSHDSMRAIAYLASSHDAARFEWHAPGKILARSEALEQQAAQCDEFWYARKLVWLTTRKQLEKKSLSVQPELPSYFATPEKDWQLARLLAKGDTPDLIFYRRRTAASPPARILAADAPQFSALLPPLPATWPAGPRRTSSATWQIPADLRGKYLSFQIDAASEAVEAFTIGLHFSAHGHPAADYLLKPYLYAAGGRDFFTIPIGATDECCEIVLRFAKSAAGGRVTGFRAIIDEPVP